MIAARSCPRTHWSVQAAFRSVAPFARSVNADLRTRACRAQFRIVGTNTDANMAHLMELEPRDLELLLATEPDRLLGKLIQLNGQPRYHNALNVIVLVGCIMDLKRSLLGSKGGDEPASATGTASGPLRRLFFPFRPDRQG